MQNPHASFRRPRRSTILLLAACLPGGPATAGPYSDPGIAPAEIVRWADAIPADSYRPAIGVGPGLNDPAAALGPPDQLLVSLGDLDQASLDSGALPGTITVQFATPLRDGPGWDLAIFENGFFFTAVELYADLAYVEVSTDGHAFARFPAVSLTTQRFEEYGTAFAGIDPTNIANLAGKHPAGEGTGLDLIALAPDPLVASGDVDLQAIRYVRLVDIPGSASFDDPLRDAQQNPAFVDASGRVILDAWYTAIDNSRDPPIAVNAGFDLDAVGARYVVPEPVSWLLFTASLITFLGRKSRPAMLGLSS